MILAQDTPSPTLLALLITGVGIVLAVFVAWRILIQERTTGATLSWLFIILAAPYLGVTLYYILGRRLHRRRLRKISRRLRTIGSDIDLPTDDDPPHPDLPIFDLLRGFDNDSVVSGNDVVLHPDGAGFAEAAQRAIDAAESFVHVQTYILRPDRTGLAVIDALTQAAARGIEVRLLYDSIGSWSLKPRHLREFVAQGGKEAEFLPLFWRHRPFTLNLRNHRKQLVVDGCVAFCGGRNIGDEYATDRLEDGAHWLDAMIEVRGPAVDRLHRVFIEDWYTAAEEKLTDPCFFPHVSAPEGGDACIGVVDGGPDQHPSPHHLTLFQLLASARTDIVISSPYVVPHQTILTSIIAAASRGVRVRIHTNGKRQEARILFHAKRAFYPALLAAGVEIFETTSDYNHAKFVLVDDEILFIGSPNLDIRSGELNFEMGVVVHGDDVVPDTARMFEERCAQSVRVQEGDLETGVFQIVTQNVCRLLAPLL